MSDTEPDCLPTVRACSACLGRTWLLGRLSGSLDLVRGRIGELLELDDDALVAAVAGRQRATVERDRAGFCADAARAAAGRLGIALLCRCAPAYPSRLRDLAAPPAVLHVAGSLVRFARACASEPVAVVGTRAPSAYGLEAGAMLGRQLAVAGLPVLSGMARGIDTAAHRAALGAAAGCGSEARADQAARAASAVTIAVLPAGVDSPYPRSQRALHARLRAEAAVVSELAPATPVRRWMFAARNRLVAALSEMTVVVEAGARSGSLVTARFANDLGRCVGAVPGRATTAQAAGPLQLLASGATLVRDAQDVLDRLFGSGVRQIASDRRPPPTAEQEDLLRWLGGGRDTVTALARCGGSPDQWLGRLAELELAGWVRRAPGGRYEVIPR